MGALNLSRDFLYPPITIPHFPLLISGTDTASSSVTVALNTISKTEVHLLEGDQPRLDQAWFWTPEWQAMEREADEDLAAGRYEDFETLDDFIEDLKRLTG